MSLRLQCALYEADGTLVRYVAGGLSAGEAAAFEDHYLLCERCQGSVRAATAARRDFAATAPRPRHRRVYAGATSVVAAAAVLLLVVRGVDEARVRRLGAVDEPPTYRATPVRAAPDAAAAPFDSAIAAYEAGRYAEALERFRRLDRTQGPVVVDFFAGISALMLDRVHEAEARFSAVIDAGASPYREEALYYRARTHLRAGREDAARADLRVVVRTAAPAAAAAAELLKRLEE